MSGLCARCVNMNECSCRMEWENDLLNECSVGVGHVHVDICAQMCASVMTDAPLI